MTHAMEEVQCHHPTDYPWRGLGPQLRQTAQLGILALVQGSI